MVSGNPALAPNGKLALIHLRVQGNKTMCGYALFAKRRKPMQFATNKAAVTCIVCLGNGKRRTPSEASLSATATALEDIPKYITRLELRATRAEENFMLMKQRMHRAQLLLWDVKGIVTDLGKMEIRLNDLMEMWRKYEAENRKASSDESDGDAEHSDGGGSGQVAGQ